MTGDRVLYIGPPARAESLAFDLAGRPERPAELVGCIEPEDRVDGLPGTTDATLVVVAPGLEGRIAVDRDVEVVAEAAFAEAWLGKVIEALPPVPAGADRGYERVKRVIDVAFALLGLLALVLVVPLVVVGNLFANRGPLLYRQERVGRYEHRIRVVKLRTMRSGPAPEADWTLDDDDPRITTFGRLLRTTHVDELPQVVNVLRGELSIVGPRPSPLGYAAELLEHLPGYDARQSVLPGMTGWAQVKFGYAGDAVGAREKLQYDLYYVKHRSLWFDLRIIARTTRTVLGASRP